MCACVRVCVYACVCVCVCVCVWNIQPVHAWANLKLQDTHSPHAGGCACRRGCRSSYAVLGSPNRGRVGALEVSIWWSFRTNQTWKKRKKRKKREKRWGRGGKKTKHEEKKPHQGIDFPGTLHLVCVYVHLEKESQKRTTLSAMGRRAMAWRRGKVKGVVHRSSSHR